MHKSYWETITLGFHVKSGSCVYHMHIVSWNFHGKHSKHQLGLVQDYYCKPHHEFDAFGS